MIPASIRSGLLALALLVGLAGNSYGQSTNVGGPYFLMNHFGEPVTDQSFLGKYQLIYFGYTFCPDVCPTALQNMTDALALLGPHAAIIQPIFITVDPERDNPEAMRHYVSHFHPRMVGLTGSVKMIDNIASRFHVHYRKVLLPGYNADEYFMEHTSAQFLMDPFGKFLMAFDHDLPPQKQARGILRAMGIE